MSTFKTGVSDATGDRIDYLYHVRQSIRRILTTPIGSCVVRREFGSHLLSLIDSAGNPEGLQRLRAAVAQALTRWEPRLNLERVDVSISADGRLIYKVVGSTRLGGLSVEIPA